jgi:dCMP deaminase
MVDGHCLRTVHAEASAICFAAKHGIALDGATLYTTGWHGGCCPACTKLAKAAGIVEIITEVE